MLYACPLEIYSLVVACVVKVVKADFPEEHGCTGQFNALTLFKQKKIISKSIRQEEAGHRYRGILLLRLRKSY